LNRKLLNELGEAAYNARKELMLTGAYPNSVVRVPDSLHFYEWDDMPEGLSKAVQEMYRKQAETVVAAFFGAMLADGSPETKQALHVLMIDEVLSSDIVMQEGGWQE
jgi:hypothetical protein